MPSCGVLNRILPVVVLTGVLFGGCAGFSQDPTAARRIRATPGGDVAGDVYDASTNLPIRFAAIALVPKPANLDAAAGLRENGASSEAMLTSVRGMSGMDGSFRLEHVPAGDYFAAAVQQGYQSPLPDLMALMTATPERLKQLAGSLASVHVSTGGVGTVHLRLQKGATIAGRIVFADGSPMIGAKVSCEPAEIATLPPEARSRPMAPLAETLLQLSPQALQKPEFVTDDKGAYRVYGLAPGKYVISSMLNLSEAAHVSYSNGSGAQTAGREHMFPELIVVYGPGVFRRQDARVIEVHGDEQVSDVDVTVATEGLHEVRGRVLAAPDGHVPTGSMVRLRAEGAKDQGRFVEIEEDGSFHMDYVPAGRYTLEVMATDRADPDSLKDGQEGTITFYRAAKLAVTVAQSDLDVQEIRLVPLKQGEMPQGPDD